MVESVRTVQEVGIDWLTCSACDEEHGPLLACLAESITDLVAEGGYEKRPWSKWGFIGESARWVSFGRRSKDTLLVLSGWAADAWARDAFRCCTNVSRLDLQVTVKTEPQEEGVARRGYDWLIANGPGARRNCTATILENSGGGSTLYVGRRSSERFLRLYDKWRESKEDAYEGCWRYELELKGQTALAVARNLCSSTERQRVIRATVHRYCADRGLEPLYTPDGEGLLLLSPRPPTSLEQRCEWLSKQVSATAVAVVDAIGLDGFLGLLGVDHEHGHGGAVSVPHPHGHHAYEDDPGI